MNRFSKGSQQKGGGRHHHLHWRADRLQRRLPVQYLQWLWLPPGQCLCQRALWVHVRSSICMKPLFSIYIDFRSSSRTIIAAASLQRSRPECWHRPTKSTRSSRITRPWWTALPLDRPFLKLHGELTTFQQRSVFLLRVFFRSSTWPLLRLRFKDSRSSTLDGDPYINHDNGTLEIRIAQAHNSGKYTCVARNILGIYENHVYLEVKGECFHTEEHRSCIQLLNADAVLSKVPNILVSMVSQTRQSIFT